MCLVFSSTYMRRLSLSYFSLSLLSMFLSAGLSLNLISKIFMQRNSSNYLIYLFNILLSSIPTPLYSSLKVYKNLIPILIAREWQPVETNHCQILIYTEGGQVFSVKHMRSESIFTLARGSPIFWLGYLYRVLTSNFIHRLNGVYLMWLTVF